MSFKFDLLYLQFGIDFLKEKSIKNKIRKNRGQKD